MLLLGSQCGLSDDVCASAQHLLCLHVAVICAWWWYMEGEVEGKGGRENEI